MYFRSLTFILGSKTIFHSLHKRFENNHCTTVITTHQSRFKLVGYRPTGYSAATVELMLNLGPLTIWFLTLFTLRCLLLDRWRITESTVIHSMWWLKQNWNLRLEIEMQQVLPEVSSKHSGIDRKALPAHDKVTVNRHAQWLRIVSTHHGKSIVHHMPLPESAE